MHLLNLLSFLLQTPQRQASGILAPALGRLDSRGILPQPVQRFRAPERACRAPWRPFENACALPGA
jgi:hypothetical protein